jgi:integrase
MTDVTAPAERREFGHIYRHPRSRFWWIRYRVDGKTYRESSGSTSHRVAEQLLARKQAELGLGAFTVPDVKRTSFDDLAQMLRDDYRINGRRSLRRAEISIEHLRAAFGSARAMSITADRIAAYVRDRQDAGAAVATIRNELAALKRMITLAVRAGKLAQRPYIPSLDVHNTRTGFFEEPDLRALLAELPEPVRPVVEFAYRTGWRIPSEVLPLRWAQVDFTAGTVRLEPGTTKNAEGRVFPFAALPALAGLLERQREYTRAVERRLGQLVPWVFHRQGKPIKGFRRAWVSACKRAAVLKGPDGKPVERDGNVVLARPDLLQRIPHDLRRTAVRNLERAGVPRSVAMQLTGHKTESVYRRYAIVAEQDLRDGVAKLAALASGAHLGHTKGQDAGIHEQRASA